MVCLTVSFPVGIGSGLLPRPMVILPAEIQVVPLRVEKTEKTQQVVFFSFPLLEGVIKCRAYGRE